MLTYKQILDDNRIIDEYKKVDVVNHTPFNHGLQHMKNVVEIMKKIIITLDINEIDANNLLIAAVLHDVGQVNGRGEKNDR